MGNNEKQTLSNGTRIQGPAKPLESFDVERENNLSYLAFSTNILFKALITVSVLLVISLISNFYLFSTHKDVKIIALTPDMRVVDIRPLDEPMISDAGLLSWYMQTISDTFSFTYNDWKDRISSMQYRYTTDAFSEIVDGFFPYIEEMANKRQIINTVFLRIPRIIKKGVERKNGPFTWYIEGFATISIEGGRTQQVRRVLIKVAIERVSPAIVPAGIIIKSLILTPA